MARTDAALLRSILPSLRQLFAPAATCSQPAYWRTFCSASQTAPSAEPSTPQAGDPAHRATVGRLLYRARQRGWLELDLLVGMWAEREVANLQPPALRDFEVLLNQDNPDLYKWLTGQLPAPGPIEHNQAFQMIRSEVRGVMKAHGCAAAAAPPQAEWVRGWDDQSKSQQPTPPAGAAAAAAAAAGPSSPGTKHD